MPSQLGLLMVTGAGASRKLGVAHRPGDDTTLPLMREWSDDLVDKMAEAETGLSKVLGLEKGLEGGQFEEKLGQLLAWSRSLRIAESLRPLGTENLLDHDSASERWFQRSYERSKLCLNVIHESLFRLFSKSNVSGSSARDAYGALLNAIPLNGKSVAYATTNYDVAAELALQALDRKPDWGQDSPIEGIPKINVEGLAELRHGTPLLHLHGRVGWYRTNEGLVQNFDPSGPYNSEVGVPALLLPDPNKDYRQDAFTAAVWNEFEQMLDAAELVIVIGHSLHDPELVKRLQAHCSSSKLAITIEPVHDRDPNLAKAAMDHVHTFLPQAHVIPMDFGPRIVTDRLALDAWLGGRERSGYPFTRSEVTFSFAR